MKKRGVPVSKKSALKLFKSCDKDGSGTIEHAELDGLLVKIKCLFPDIDEEKEEIFEAAHGSQNTQAAKEATRKIQRGSSAAILGTSSSAEAFPSMAADTAEPASLEGQEKV